MKQAFIIRDKEAGNIIEYCDSLQEAQNTVACFEADDKENNCYTKDFYEIVPAADISISSNEYFNMESFGSDCPKNWKEIADYLNSLTRFHPSETEIEWIWESFCNGNLENCPEPIF